MDSPTRPTDAWQPMTVHQVEAIFSQLGVPWWIAGGWALDLYLGHQTRVHRDIDIAMLRSNELALGALPDDLRIYVAHEGELTPWDGELLSAERHQLWIASAGVWRCEVLLEQHDGLSWIFRRDQRISLPLDEFGATSVTGTPIVAPHVALLYKANAYEIERNEADYRVAVPALNLVDRLWLRGALKAVYGMHPWLDER